MYMTESHDFTWEQRRDAETLVNAQAIQNDPVRLRNARAVIERSAQESVAALKGKPIPPFPRGRRNPATISMLKVRY